MNGEYVRRQILYCLLQVRATQIHHTGFLLTSQQEDDGAVLHISAAVLLFDGRINESTFEMMQSEGVFARLVELIRDSHHDDDGLHKLLLELLFEMSRMQRLHRDELSESKKASSQCLSS